MPGTQEARKRMRFEIEALRIKFGTPIFVTFSPDEAHQMLYVRLSRARFGDPVRAASAYQNWDVSDREYPPLDGKLYFANSCGDLLQGFANMGAAAPSHGSGPAGQR